MIFFHLVGPHNSRTMETYIGLNQIQFNHVLSIVLPSLLSVFKSVDKSEIALYIYLMKLRTGQTYGEMAPLFNVSMVTICSRVRTVRDILHANFVSLYLYNRKRKDILQNATTFSRMLYGVSENSATVCWDATYVFTIKSSNYDFQKKTYSLQHERNLVKFMLCVSTNGFIEAVYGPFNAKTNDATILNIIMNEQGNIFGEFREGDVFIIDRGFRDCIRALKDRGFIVKSPRFSAGNQMTRTEANESRFATKTRFVVEVRNTHIKNKWKHLSGTKAYQFIPHLKMDFEIAASLVNAFSSKIINDKSDWCEIVDLMHTKFDQGCRLPSIVQHIPDSSYAIVQNLTLFPKFSYKNLKNIVHGTYQIRQARSYCQSHLRANNDAFIIKVCEITAVINARLCKILKENTSQPLLLMLDIKSRFRANVAHKVHVLLSLDLNNKYVVNEYCCTCKHGRRTVGCCSHVVLLIWFTLFVDQAQIKHLLPSKNLDTIFDKWDELYVPDNSDTESSIDFMSEFSESD